MDRPNVVEEPVEVAAQYLSGETELTNVLQGITCLDGQQLASDNERARRRARRSTLLVAPSGWGAPTM
jgi:hypothetical protein